ncbi:MAG: hypothetical protein A4E32_01845 [Methanomassiliicoccales archaeon PtaU1.Bin124]|nr:MAG: hypothetical protein A4E32_01845 [Methanomassiliicoccales archaeon PtaU1.Bin124]
MQKRGFIALLAIFLLVGSAIPVAVGESSTGISITDSRNVTTNLTQPATHVAAFGAFATITLVDIGYLDKAVMFDATSAYSKSGIVEVQNFSADKFVTVSSANKDAVVQKMLDLVDNGTWNKDNDVILGYGYSYLSSVWTALEGYGFKVITFYPNTYDGIVQVVEDIETVVGADHKVSEQMSYVKTFIAQTLAEHGINDTQKVTAVYLSYSSSVWKMGNGGSVTVDFINYAGGNNLGNNTAKAIPTYSVDLTAVVQLSPDYVLLDGYYTGSATDFSALLGDSSIHVYKLNKTWNSYCPDAMTGLWTVAGLFYPSYFEGKIPNAPASTQPDNTMLYVGVGAVVVIVAVAAVVLMKKRKA